MVLDGLSSLYGLKYDSATAYGMSLYLCSYKLVGSATRIHLIEVLLELGKLRKSNSESVVKI